MVSQQMGKMEYCIDVVITWIDGETPEMREKIDRYITELLGRATRDVSGRTRYSCLGEIHWCVRSINKFMPWVRRIFIVTDSQDPHVVSDIPVEIVDHKIIFRGYEQFLPTFNSLTLETLLWRIPGLSEHFVYFNDDCMVIKPATPEDFFVREGIPVCYGRIVSYFNMRCRYALKEFFKPRMRVSPGHSILKAAELLGGERFLPRTTHTPKPCLKSVFEHFYAENPMALVNNIRFKFRNEAQFRSDTLCYSLLMREGRICIKSAWGVLLEYNPTKGMAYMQRKFKSFDEGHDYLFLCVNSLDACSHEVLMQITSRIERRLS